MSACELAATTARARGAEPQMPQPTCRTLGDPRFGDVPGTSPSALLLPAQLRPVLPAAELLERGDVCVLRAAAAPHGDGTAGAGLSPRRPWPAQRGSASIILIAGAPGSSGATRPGRDSRDARRKGAVGGEAWESGGLQRRVLRDGGKNVCWLSSREEQHFPRAVVWAGGTKLRAREFPLFLTGASNKSPLWGLITAWLRVSLPFGGIQGHCLSSTRDTSQADILCLRIAGALNNFPPISNYSGHHHKQQLHRQSL